MTTKASDTKKVEFTDADECANQLKRLEGLVVEICGSWVWVAGDTIKHKQSLKTMGLFWSPSKRKWYWKPPNYMRRNRKSMSMGYIRTTHGSDVVKGQIDEAEV